MGARRVKQTRRGRGRFVNRPYEGSEGCGVHRVWCDVRPSGGASPSPTFAPEAGKKTGGIHLAAFAIPGPASLSARQWRGCGKTGAPYSAPGGSVPLFHRAGLASMYSAISRYSASLRTMWS